MSRFLISAGVMILAALVCALPQTAFADDEGFRTYANARFGYALQYPSALLVAKKEADNGDGRRFESRDRKVLLRAFGAYNVNNQSVSSKLRSVAADWRADGANITYQKSGEGWYAVSGFVGGDIFYEKALLRNGAFATIIWEYAKSYRQRLDVSVTRTVRSFRFGAMSQDSAPVTPHSTASIPKPRIVAMRPLPSKAPTKAPIKAHSGPVVSTRKAKPAAPAPRATSSRGY